MAFSVQEAISRGLKSRSSSTPMRTGNGVFVKLTGWEELIAKLRSIAPELRKRVMRNALAAGARLVRDDARRRAPVLVNAAKVPYRTPGLVRSRIVVRTSKEARRRGDLGVFVNVKPAKGAKYKTSTSRILGLKVRTRTLVRAGDRGAKSKVDPFYWRFLEFGTKHMAARPFLQPAAERLPAAFDVVKRMVNRWVERANAAGRLDV